MNQHIAKILLTLSSTILLTACAGDDDDDNTSPITQQPGTDQPGTGTPDPVTPTPDQPDPDKSPVPQESYSYVAQMVAPDYSSSQLGTGNVIGDRTATQEVLATAQSDYDIASYGPYLYHLGRYNIDTIARYDATSGLTQAEWTYSTNDANSAATANPYTLVQNADDNAYLIRYGATTIWQVDPSATAEADFVKATIDLSAYTVGGERAATVPHMAGAVIENNTLFVIVQRLDSWWSPQVPYLIAIDLDTNEEIDTDPQQDGLKGIPLNATNPMNIEAHNGSIYVSGRGDYGSNSGALDKIDASTYEVTNLINGVTLASLNNVAGNTYYHVTDIAPVSDQLAYTVITLETGYTADFSLIYPVNPQTGVVGATVPLAEQANKVVSDIAVGPYDRLWISISDSSDPKLLVMDTDTNTQNGDSIALDMPAKRILFLDTTQ